MDDHNDNLLSPQQESSLQDVFDRLVKSGNFSTTARKVMLGTLLEAYCGHKPRPIEELYPYKTDAIYDANSTEKLRAALGFNMRTATEADIAMTKNWFSMAKRGLPPAKRVRLLHLKATGEKLS